MTSNTAPRVKALEWSNDQFAGRFGTVVAVAKIGFGNYFIERMVDNLTGSYTGRYILILTGQCLLTIEDDAIEPLKAAAQADFEARILAALEPQEADTALHGPFGWLNGCRWLSEECWTLESDPIENSDEYFAIPLYAQVDPFKETGKGPTPYSAEPMAWLGEGDGFKSFTRQKSVADRWGKSGIKVTPVYPPRYTAPVPAKAAGALTNAKIRMLWADAGGSRHLDPMEISDGGFWNFVANLEIEVRKQEAAIAALSPSSAGLADARRLCAGASSKDGDVS